jgi:branched-chain amino acid transport system ATP-binding protein
MELLELRDLRANYGIVEVLHGISLKMKKGQIVTFIGANGAGKSTVLKAISGLMKRIFGHVPEGRQLFPWMTVLENLEMGAYLQRQTKKVQRDLTRVFDLFPRLKERQKQEAGSLSGVEQQMVAVGRALMSEPKLMLMDEPSLGLSPLLVKQVADMIVEINKSGVSIILVEQNANLALTIADAAYVMERGCIALDGDSKDLLGNDLIRKAYLGL